MRKDNNTNGPSAKPFLPALSSRFRAARSPVTPKLAGSAQSSPALSPRREPHPNIASVASRNTPPLDSNVTPRSGTRRSRIGTESPATPAGIAAVGAKRTRATSTSDGSSTLQGMIMNGTGLGISSPVSRPYAAIRPKTAVSSSASVPNLVRRSSATKSGFSSEDTASTSPFFHADDAKSSISSHDLPERPKLGPKATTFHYLGTESRADVNKASANASPRPDAAKFFHANDLAAHPPQQPSQRHALRNKSSAISLRSPKLHSPQLQRNTRSPTRPPSPLKETTYRSVVNTPISPPKSKSTMAPVLTGNMGADTARRRSASNTVSQLQQPLHKKSLSVSSSGASVNKTPSSPKTARSPRPEIQISPKSPSTQQLSKGEPELTSPVSPSPRSTTLASPKTIPRRLSSINRADALDSTWTAPPPLKPPDISPTTAQPPRPPSSDATNARRERKVLDLEISNSSLLAINRTLEREMRKQNAELRRFRRLSRSGRLSMRAASGQSKSSLDTLAELEDEEDDHLSDLEQSDSDSSTISQSSPTSSSASAASSGQANRQRRHDEKRLMLDLSKHRQLLVDSEKMNSSIRRCLGWTEELIRDGTKALAYKVSIGDMKLGGKVLNFDHDDDEQPEERSMSLVSPIRDMDAREEASLWDDAAKTAPLQGSAFDGSPFDRDSGDQLGISHTSA